MQCDCGVIVVGMNRSDAPGPDHDSVGKQPKKTASGTRKKPPPTVEALKRKRRAATRAEKQGSGATKFQDRYDAIAAQYRALGYTPTKVAAACHVNVRTAMRYWHLGCPEIGAEPIHVVITREQIEARRRIEEEKRAETQANRAAVTENATETRKKEGQILELQRAAVLQNSVVATNLAMGARRLAEMVNRKLQALADTPDKVDVFDAVKLLKTVADTTGKITAAAHELMEMERLHLGEPTQIIELVKEELTVSEIEARVEAAQRALRRVQSVTATRGVIDTTASSVASLKRTTNIGRPATTTAPALRLRSGTRVS